MHTHIDSDIRFDENLELSKDKKKKLIENLDVGNHLSLGLLSELKKSMNSDTSSDSDLESKGSIPTTGSIISNLSLTNFKEILKTNVNKVSNILQICSTNNENVINSNISHEDITKLFSNIEFSCGEIINSENSENSENINKNENIGLILESDEKQNVQEKYVEVFTKPIFEAKENVLNELKEFINYQNKEITEENKEELILELNQEHKQEQNKKRGGKKE
jgi:hypothetical protein